MYALLTKIINNCPIEYRFATRDQQNKTFHLPIQIYIYGRVSRHVKSFNVNLKNIKTLH